MIRYSSTPQTDAERRSREAFDDEIIDRLFVLNAERAEEERRLGLVASARGRGGGRKRLVGRRRAATKDWEDCLDDAPLSRRRPARPAAALGCQAARKKRLFVCRQQIGGLLYVLIRVEGVAIQRRLFL